MIGPGFLRCTAILGIMVALFADHANASDMCVKEVPIVVNPNAKLSDDDGFVRSDQPEFFKLPVGADYPLVFSLDRKPTGERRYFTRNAYWRLNRDRTLFGPIYPDPPGTNVASDRDPIFGGGKTYFIAGGYSAGIVSPESAADKGKWRTSIYQASGGDAPSPVGSEIQEHVGRPTALSWSELLKGLLASSYRNDVQGRTTYKSILVRHEQVTSLGEIDIGQGTDLPKLGVTALWNPYELRLIDAGLTISKIARLYPGELGGHTGVYETADSGWIYLGTGDWDYALKIDHQKEGWRAARIIQIKEDHGILVNYLLAVIDLLIQRENRFNEVDRSYRLGPCRKFSKALSRMIFCDHMLVLREGELVTVGNAFQWFGLTQYLGDSEHLGMALFLGWGGMLYGYDGERLHAIGRLTGRGLVHDLVASKRTFITAVGGLFEVRSIDGQLEVVTLTRVPEPSSGYLFADFYQSPDGGGVMVFLSHGIYRLVDDKLAPFWKPASGTINITGHMGPTPVSGWNGVLFTTSTEVAGASKFFLLTACGVQP